MKMVTGGKEGPEDTIDAISFCQPCTVFER